MQAGAFLYMRYAIKDLADHPADGDGRDRLADALYRQGQGKTDVPLTAGAKLKPGVQITPALSISSRQKAMLSV